MAGAMAGVVLAFLAPSGPVPSPAPADVPRLIEQIKTSYGSSAVHAFRQIGQPAVPALIEVLSDHTLPDGDNVKQPARYQAALALEYIGPAAKEAVPTLLATLRDRNEDEGVRWAAASALASIGDGFRQVVVLHDMEGYSHEEIAALLGIGVGASRMRLCRARLALRAFMIGHE